MTKKTPQPIVLPQPPVVSVQVPRIAPLPTSDTWRAIIETTVPTVYPGRRACR